MVCLVSGAGDNAAQIDSIASKSRGEAGRFWARVQRSTFSCYS